MNHLEPGKKYTTRNGKTATVTEQWGQDYYRGFVHLKLGNAPCTWNPDGTRVCYATRSPYDLITDWNPDPHKGIK